MFDWQGKSYCDIRQPTGRRVVEVRQKEGHVLVCLKDQDDWFIAINKLSQAQARELATALNNAAGQIPEGEPE
jgi:hypothetical protein